MPAATPVPLDESHITQDSLHTRLSIALLPLYQRAAFLDRVSLHLSARRWGHSLTSLSRSLPGAASHPPLGPAGPGRRGGQAGAPGGA